MLYNIEKIREEKATNTWKYIFSVYFLGSLSTYSLLKNIHLLFEIDNLFLFIGTITFIIGLIGNIAIKFKLNVFNLLLYTINRILLTIGFHISLIIGLILLFPYLKGKTTLPDIIFYIAMFVISFFLALVFNFTKKSNEKVADKEELALTIYDEWIVFFQLLKRERDRKNRLYLMSRLRELIAMDSRNQIGIITDKMKDDFVEECDDILNS